MNSASDKKRAVPLTDKVVRGLALAKAAISTAPQEVLFGTDTKMDAEERAGMSDWEAAERWIEDQQRRRGL